MQDSGSGLVLSGNEFSSFPLSLEMRGFLVPSLDGLRGVSIE
jgi:hypothetical protein